MLLGGRDPQGLGGAFRAALLHSAFKRTHEAYMAKSAGGIDAYGENWKKLAPGTIAARPISASDQRRFGVQKGQRGLLTPKENQRWKGIFASVFLQSIQRGADEKTAKEIAGRMAWAILKSQGAKTRIGTLSQRSVSIMIDSGKLEQSYRPGAFTGRAYRRYNQDQVAEVRPRSIRFGSRVAYARDAVAKRPVIPTAKQFLTDIVVDARDALLRSLQREA